MLSPLKTPALEACATSIHDGSIKGLTGSAVGAGVMRVGESVGLAVGAVVGSCVVVG